MRWICKKCNKKWIYPIERCIYCKDAVEKQIGKKVKVVGVTKILIPSPEHPIIPYYALILEDEHGNRMPKKTMKEYKLGESYRWEKSDDESAVSIIKIKYDFYEAIKHALQLIGDIDVNPSSKVLIKPNIMADAYSYQAITTNPKVVKVLIEYLFEKGVKKENVTIAEQTQFGEFEKAANKSGFSSLANELGVKLVDLGKTEFIEKEFVPVFTRDDLISIDYQVYGMGDEQLGIASGDEKVFETVERVDTLPKYSNPVIDIDRRRFEILLYKPGRWEQRVDTLYNKMTTDVPEAELLDAQQRLGIALSR